MATTSERTAAEVAQDYFGSIRAGDTTPQQRAYADDAVGSVQGLFAEARKPDFIAFFDDLYRAFPDFRFEVLDLFGDGDRAVCHWRVTGTFAGPGTFQGLEPNGARVSLQGADVVRVRDGLIVRNDAYTDTQTLMRQLGVAPPADVAGFEVVHLPGHAPGLIALWRASDRVALTSDVFYALDMWGRDAEPLLPIDGFNFDTEQARSSLRKLAALEPAVCWPGHADAVRGDVRAKLERAADAS